MGDVSIPGADAGLAGGETPDAVEEAGRFRIYLGAAAGVGKTYAVLTAEAGLARWEAG
jgi:K+-sensing histidine kinase KdpD